MEKLILGCGPHHPKISTETRVDRIKFPNVDIVHDLDVFPWPWKTESVTGIVATHVVEHLRSLLIPFMDECWRILVPGGDLYIETPCAGRRGYSNLQWDDPTHVRCYTKHSFINYLTLEGVHKFGYTKRAWNLAHLEVRSDGVLVVHAYPIKK